VRTIFVARLDRLAEEIRAVVQAAAILGREFEVRALAAMLGLEEEAGELPAELIGLVAAAEQESIWAALAELRYLFKHALLRDAAYEMQLQAHRRGLHQLAAEALERLYARDLSPHYGEIAYHYEAACRQGLEEVRPLACQYLEQAGQQAATRYENAAAVGFYGRALQLFPEEAEEDRLRLLWGREAIYFLMGQREEEWADLQTLSELVQGRQLPAEQAELALRQARLANATGDFARAQAQSQVAVAAAQAAGEVALEAKARLGLATARWRLADYAGAAEQGQLTVALARAAACKDIEAGGLMLQGTVATFQGNYATARQHVEQALLLCREIGDRRGEGGALNNLGTVIFHQGDYITVRPYFERALAVFREIGERRAEGGVLGNLGSVATYQGDYATARPYIEQHLAICREVGDRQAEGLVLNNLGGVAFFQGDYAAARRYLELSLAVSQDIGDRRGEGLAFKNLGRAVASQGDYAAARPYYEQALAISRQLSLAHYTAENLVGLAEVALAQGDQDGARAYVLEVLPILEVNPTLKGAEHPRRALLGCGRVLLALDDPRGQPILVEAYNRLQEQAFQIADEAARSMFLEDIPEHRDLAAEFARLTVSQAAPAVEVDKLPSRTGKKKGKKGRGQERERGKRGKRKES
jgi:tetratricopeptide (TPR) repeat protein